MDENRLIDEILFLFCSHPVVGRTQFKKKGRKNQKTMGWF